jgi:hypothetical protein
MLEIAYDITGGAGPGWRTLTELGMEVGLRPGGPGAEAR